MSEEQVAHLLGQLSRGKDGTVLAEDFYRCYTSYLAPLVRLLGRVWRGGWPVGGGLTSAITGRHG